MLTSDFMLTSGKGYVFLSLPTVKYLHNANSLFMAALRQNAARGRNVWESDDIIAGCVTC